MGMIVRKLSDGELILIGQTDHSRLVGQLAAHWGNAEIPTPDPYESVVRAATFHDYGWLRYETSPLIDANTGEPYQFLGLPHDQKQLDAYQWCIDWLADIDRYSALIVSRHRTGLWQGRYRVMKHPVGKYDIQKLSPEVRELIDHNEAWQEREMKALDSDRKAKFPTNYRLMQVWDLLGLYFCCQEPCEDSIDPIPLSYSDESSGGQMTMTPVGDRQVRFEPYPFDVRPLRVQLSCKRLPQTSFSDVAAFRRAYFQAGNEILEYEMV
jgi:hypothetical protein